MCIFTLYIYIYILSNQTTKQVHHRSTMIFCVVVGLSDMGHFRDHLILNSKVGTSEALKVGDGGRIRTGIKSLTRW